MVISTTKKHSFLYIDFENFGIFEFAYIWIFFEDLFLWAPLSQIRGCNKHGSKWEFLSRRVKKD